MLRYCEKFIVSDLKKKMVFIGGPRQVGKTTMARHILQKNHATGEYLNWDFDADRKRIMATEWNSNDDLIIFDELHKYPRWKQWIKGVYDVKSKEQNYLVTGSARLDVYRRGGDSLMGRYHYWRLHPFTIDELPRNFSKKEAMMRLMKVGGFPEPFLHGDEREARRWRNERFSRILKEDVRDLEDIRNIQLLNLFVDALRERAGSLISISNIANELQISPSTAKKWLALVERMYIGFAVYPYSKNLPRSILKPLKFYFYDNADVAADNEGARFENLVATTLLKRLDFLTDYHGFKCQLHYIRDKDSREVDFVTIVENKVEDLIEVKLSEKDISSSLCYYSKVLQPKRAVQIVYNLKNTFDKENILVTTAEKFFVNAPWDD